MWFFKKKKNKNKEEINLKIDTITDDIFLEEKEEEIKNEIINEKSYEQLKEEAERKNISMASLVRIICSEYFDNN